MLIREIGNAEMNGACNTHRDIGNAYSVVVWKPKAKTSLGDLDVDGKIILKFMILCLKVLCH
jgi:hypothetical protein